MSAIIECFILVDDKTSIDFLQETIELFKRAFTHFFNIFLPSKVQFIQRSSRTIVAVLAGIFQMNIMATIVLI